MTSRRYSRWDGSQNPFGADLPIDDIVAEFSDDLLQGLGADNALRRMLERGMPGEFGGLRDLRQRLRELREAQERRGSLDDVFGDIREQLERVLDIERTELAMDDSDTARFKELTLDAMPDSPARQIQELQNYEFASEGARTAFEELVDELRAQMLEQQFRSISDAMGSVTEEDMARVKDMMADLNAMLDEHRAGTGPSEETFDQFMDKHGEFFPENPRNIEELLEALARRAAAFSRFMASLSPEQQRELMELSNALMDDLDLQFEMDRLGQSLRELAPGLAWDQPGDLDGPPMGLAEGLAAMDELSQLEQLERMLDQNYPGATLDDIDREMLASRLGEDAVRDLDKLRQIERALQEAGVVSRSDGRLELTPRGVRKLGQRALARVFEEIVDDQPGSHEVAAAGGDGDLIGSTRPWQFGDPFRLDLRKTVHNAVLRQGPTSGAVQLSPEDFEIAEAERRTAVATVLLLDMSRSMPLRGHWVHAKRMALALHSLITMQYPEDRLSIVGFSAYAREMDPTDLATVDWDPSDYGTNMEHAFNLAGRILAKQRGASKQVLLVTDGEPTAHLVGDQVFFNWPPVWETLDKTYREAMRLARSGVTMNIFMLEQEPGLTRFVDELAQLVNGRVFNLTSDAQLGEMAVRDYMKRR
jgi:uncharacterized protein with von Willebrand factor type A (vWA) domain